MIKVFPSQMPGSAIEVHEFSGLISDWFKQNGLDFESKEDQPITLSVDGKSIPSDKWSSIYVDPDDEVEIRIIPHGWGIILYTLVIALTIAAVMMARRPQAMLTNNNQNQQGRNLDSSTAQANRAMLNSVVPELAGLHKRYPDYLTQPRRYFQNDREQILEFLCCIGPGEYQINTTDIKVGDTPFSSIGDDSSYIIYAPNEDLSNDPAHINWYNVKEVGGTSSGSAGLELSSEFSSDITPPSAAYSFNENQITIPPGPEIFPVGWGEGTRFSVSFLLPYVVTLTTPTLPDTPYNVFFGNFSNIAPISTGDLISINGTNYVVYLHEMQPDGSGYLSFSDASDPSIHLSNFPLGNQNIRFTKSGRLYTVTQRSDKYVNVVANQSGWPGWIPITPSSISFAVDSSSIYGDWSNWFAACPLNEETSTIEVDFFFPQGLAYVNDDGSLSGYSASVEVEWRDSYTQERIGNQIYSYTRATPDQIGMSERISFSAMRPEVRVRRISSYNPEQRVRNTVQWYGLKSILDGVNSYPKWTTMSVRMRTGGRLSAQSENQINLIATRILPTLTDEGWTDPIPTRDISALVKYICSTIGYTDENINIDELRRLQAIWTARGETADYVYDQTTVKNALNVALGAGMAELTVSEGQIKGVRDDVRTQKEYSYSPLNMTGPLRRKFRAPRNDDADGVEVEFINEQTWTKETIDCLLPGDLGIKKARIKVEGVTNKTRAWRIGMRYRRDLKYRVWEYDFSTELDGLNSEYLSYDFLFDDVPGYGKAAIMRSITAYEGKALIQSAEPLTWDDTLEYVVAYRRPDGTLAGPFEAEKGPDDYAIIADIPLPWPVISLKQEPPHVFIGTTERWTFPVLVTEVTPRGTDSVDLKAMNYDDRVYADDNNEPE